MSRDGPEAGSPGVTAGVPPQGHAEVRVANPSELVAYLLHQTQLSQCLVHDGRCGQGWAWSLQAWPQEHHRSTGERVDVTRVPQSRCLRDTSQPTLPGAHSRASCV